MGAGGAQGANTGGEVDTSFLDDFLNDNDFSNAININNNHNNNNINNANVSTSNQNTNNEQTSRHHRNNKSKFDIYLPNI